MTSQLPVVHPSAHLFGLHASFDLPWATPGFEMCGIGLFRVALAHRMRALRTPLFQLEDTFACCEFLGSASGSCRHLTHLPIGALVSFWAGCLFGTNRKRPFLISSQLGK